jgi:hypothetical protein
MMSCMEESVNKGSKRDHSMNNLYGAAERFSLHTNTVR